VIAEPASGERAGALGADTVIVVPCYNEAARLDVAAYRTFLRNGGAFLMFVDDGSTDATRSVLESIREGAPDRCDVAPLARNVGKAEAVRAGVERALARGATYVGYWDADLSTSLDEVPAFRDVLAARPELMGVLASRIRRLGADIQRNPMRHYFGRVFATCASIALGIPVYDTQCGAKLFRATDEVREIFAGAFESRWIFDVEILARLLRARRNRGLACDGLLVEYPLRRWRDVAGSKLKALDGAVALVELARIWRTYR
jgi:glycosyltransferase involved in cell wall biosynthesis